MIIIPVIGWLKRNEKRDLPHRRCKICCGKNYSRNGRPDLQHRIIYKHGDDFAEQENLALWCASYLAIILRLNIKVAYCIKYAIRV